MTKDSCSGGIGKDDCATFVHADHGVGGRFDHEAVLLFTVAARGFFTLPFSNIRNDTADGIDLALCVEQRELLDDARVLPVFLEVTSSNSIGTPASSTCRSLA